MLLCFSCVSLVSSLLQAAWDKGLNSHLRWTKFPWEQAAFIAMLKSSPKLCSRVVLLPFLVDYPQGRVQPSAPANSCTLSWCPWSSSNRGYPLPLFHATGSARLRMGHERLDWIIKALIAANRTMTPKAGISFMEAAEDGGNGSVGRHHQLQCSPESVHAWFDSVSAASARQRGPSPAEASAWRSHFRCRPRCSSHCSGKRETLEVQACSGTSSGTRHPAGL